jgi:pyoverdine/dityrosine biosynthesis protein Dit1
MFQSRVKKAMIRHRFNTITGLEPQKASLQDKLKAEMAFLDEAGAKLTLRDSPVMKQQQLASESTIAERPQVVHKRRSSAILSRYKDAQTVREQKREEAGYANKSFSADMFKRNPIFQSRTKAADMDDLDSMKKKVAQAVPAGRPRRRSSISTMSSAIDDFKKEQAASKMAADFAKLHQQQKEEKGEKKESGKAKRRPSLETAEGVMDQITEEKAILLQLKTDQKAVTKNIDRVRYATKEVNEGTGEHAGLGEEEKAAKLGELEGEMAKVRAKAAPLKIKVKAAEKRLKVLAKVQEQFSKKQLAEMAVKSESEEKETLIAQLKKEEAAVAEVKKDQKAVTKNIDRVRYATKEVNEGTGEHAGLGEEEKAAKLGELEGEMAKVRASAGTFKQKLKAAQAAVADCKGKLEVLAKKGAQTKDERTALEVEEARRAQFGLTTTKAVELDEGQKEAEMLRLEAKALQYISSANDMTLKIVEVVESILWRAEAGDLYEPRGRGYLCMRIADMVAKKQPILFLILGFPWKSPNLDKVLGDLPDLAEKIAIDTLGGFCNAINAIYPHGSRLVLLSDGIIWNDLFDVPEEVMLEYLLEIQNMAERASPSLEARSLYDFFQSPESEEEWDAEAIRGEVFRVYRPSIQWARETKAKDKMFKRKGADFQRFVMEDMDPTAFASTAERKGAAKQISESMLCRDEALGRFSEHALPEAIRFSIRPKDMCGPKVSDGCP